jgi:hypothetical protein
MEQDRKLVLDHGRTFFEEWGKKLVVKKGTAQLKEQGNKEQFSVGTRKYGMVS